MSKKFWYYCKTCNKKMPVIAQRLCPDCIVELEAENARLKAILFGLDLADVPDGAMKRLVEAAIRYRKMHSIKVDFAKVRGLIKEKREAEQQIDDALKPFLKEGKQ